ncbi:MAG: MBG domain-containing protein, partial [Desulfuromonadaceae bacterium]
DTVALDVSAAAGAFADKNVGIGKAVTVSGLTLTGADAGNYTVSDASGATANITAKAITASGITAANKVYDATVTATLNTGSATLTGGAAADDDDRYYTGDTVALDVSAAAGAFADKKIGIGKAVTVSGLTLTGADAGNYTVSDASGATANITVKAITVTANAAGKTYGDADPGLTYGTDVPLVGSDSFTGALSRTAGENVGNYAIGQNTLAIDDGNGGNNYSLTYGGNNLTIGQRAITLTANAVSKTYGTADPALSVSITAGSLGSVTVNDNLADVTGALTREAGEAVGAYDVLLGTGVKASNYTIGFIIDNNAFTIVAEETSTASIFDQTLSSILASLTSPSTQVNGTQEQFGSAVPTGDLDKGNIYYAMGPNGDGGIFQGIYLGELIIDHTGYRTEEGP